MANRSLFTITFSSSDSSSEEPPEEPIKPKPPTRLKPAVRRLSPRSNSPQPDPEPKTEPESEPEQPQSPIDEKQTDEESAKVANGDADVALEGDKPPPAAKVTYHVIRKTSRGLKGKRVHFQLVQDEQPLLHTKIKSDAPDTLFIAKGTDMHFSGSEFEGVILATSNMTSYSCRKAPNGRQDKTGINERQDQNTRKEKDRMIELHPVSTERQPPPTKHRQPGIPTKIKKAGASSRHPSSSDKQVFTLLD